MLLGRSESYCTTQEAHGERVATIVHNFKKSIIELKADIPTIDQTAFQAGVECAFPFSVTVPAHVPMSVELDHHNFISYCITAAVELTGSESAYEEKAFHVNQKASFIQDDKLVPVSKEYSTYLNRRWLMFDCDCCKFTTMLSTVQLSRSAYAIGDTIGVSLVLKCAPSWSDLLARIHSIDVELMQTTNKLIKPHRGAVRTAMPMITASMAHVQISPAAVMEAQFAVPIETRPSFAGLHDGTPDPLTFSHHIQLTLRLILPGFTPCCLGCNNKYAIFNIPVTIVAGMSAAQAHSPSVMVMDRAIPGKKYALVTANEGAAEHHVEVAVDPEDGIGMVQTEGSRL